MSAANRVDQKLSNYILLFFFSLSFCRGYLKPPFNTEGRSIAGMSEEVFHIENECLKLKHIVQFLLKHDGKYFLFVLVVHTIGQEVTNKSKWFYNYFHLDFEIFTSFICVNRQ